LIQKLGPLISQLSQSRRPGQATFQPATVD
jgi:hypothetical protein